MQQGEVVSPAKIGAVRVPVNYTMRTILLAIVISQFFCTSLWFAGNAVLPYIIKSFESDAGLLADLTSAVQFGFITGTLLFAVFNLSDRFSPSKVFFYCAIIAAGFNLGMCIVGISPTELLMLRFLTGFFLAGIYPVGMKIAADHYGKGLGKALGFLVGALVLGTALPHLLKGLSSGLPWKYIIICISLLSLLGGGIILLFVPDGPYRKPGQKPAFTAFLSGFRNSNFRAAAFGYFGHMWELYTFWVFVPVMLMAYNKHFHTDVNVSLLSFAVIASGGVACVLSGVLSQYRGAKKIATISLILSGVCCLLSPLFLLNASAPALVIFLIIWGMTAVADSPLFSTLVAQNVPEQIRGSALTIVNCIGFSVTILSIQFVKILSEHVGGEYVYILLGMGPLFGVIAMVRNKKSQNHQKIKDGFPLQTE